MNRPTPRRGRLIVGLIAIGAGLIPLLIGAGVIPADQANFNAPHWVVALAGLAFIFAGAAILFGAPDGEGSAGARALGLLMFLATIAALATIATWVSIGPGAREFSSSAGIPGVEITSSGDPTVGRIVFGIGALITWGVFLLALVQGVRTLTKPH